VNDILSVTIFFEKRTSDDVSCEIPWISTIVMAGKIEYMFFYPNTRVQFIFNLKHIEKNLNTFTNS
jgi:hypothetical protein